MFSGNMTQKKREQLADFLIEFQKQIDFKVSARGWCYQLEQMGYISKGKFNSVDDAIGRCIEDGLLPVDFVAHEVARQFSGVETPETSTPLEMMYHFTENVLRFEDYYTLDWWADEDYYIQVVVEKVDLKSLFESITSEYHIPIANSKGWSSRLQRAEYCRRFKEAEERGIQPVLLYMGDHDPDGIRISDTLKKNLDDLKNVFWSDGGKGYNPENLIIKRFGLNYDIIKKLNLTWIDNLETGGKKKGVPNDLSYPEHPNHFLPYVQKYLKKFGARKCEANAIIPYPNEARKLLIDAIEQFLGVDAKKRFEAKKQALKNEVDDYRKRTGIEDGIKSILSIIENS